MLEFEVDHHDGNDSDGSTLSLDSEFGVPIMRTTRAKKVLTLASEKLRRTSREKNLVIWLGYNEYMAHNYAFVMRVARNMSSRALQKWLVTRQAFIIGLRVRNRNSHKNADTERNNTQPSKDKADST